MPPLSPDLPGLPSKTRSITLDLGVNSVGIHIGPNILPALGQLLAQNSNTRRFGIVSDTMVASHYLSAIERGLQDAGLDFVTFIVEPGEASKSFPVLERLCDDILRERFERKDCLLALGGGIVGDLTGFAAAIVKRGMDYIQLPTSLLAQVDSSVGGKTGINTPRGKNLIGAFNQPAATFIDTDTLESLPPRHLKAGYAEVVKYATINDAPFFDWLEERGSSVLAPGEDRITAIAKCCEAKAAIVAQDERETGTRALLNLGHTFAHALESETGYSEQLYHGEAVGLGLAMAFRFSKHLGLVDQSAVSRVEKHLAAMGLSTRLFEVGIAQGQVLYPHMLQDKKAQGGALTFILVRGIGQAFIARSVPAEDITAFLHSESEAS